MAFGSMLPSSFLKSSMLTCVISQLAKNKNIPCPIQINRDELNVLYLMGISCFCVQ